MRETGCNKTSKRRYYLRIQEIIVVALIALNILLSGTALAKTITVDAGGNGDYTTIQDAIDSNIHSIDEIENSTGELTGYWVDDHFIDSNVTIIVYPGVYNESLKLLFPLILKAYSSNPADTVIESGEYAIDLTGHFSNTEGKYLVSGFTIKGYPAGVCHNEWGRTIFITIENNLITQGTYGIVLNSDVPTIKNNKFNNNEIGICTDDSGPVNIIDNEFINNNNGVAISNSYVVVNNNLFTKNGLAIAAHLSNMQITHNVIKDNMAGISFDNSGSASDSQIYNNNFNNAVNIEFPTLMPQSCVLSIGVTEGPNIIGGPSIGGNFWGNPDSTGFSQICPDVDLDGFCDEPYVILNGDFFNITDYLPLKEKVSPPEPVLSVANFSSNVTSGYAPLSVQFTDLSENTTEWNWNFGDGSGSTDQSPTHTYSSAGTYTVSLTVSNSKGTDTRTATITVLERPVPPIANFSATPITGKAPLTVTFTDKSTGSPTSWSWNFSDKSTSIDQNPVHTYSKAGKYTVSLTVKNALGNNTKKVTKYIVVTNK